MRARPFAAAIAAAAILLCPVAAAAQAEAAGVQAFMNYSVTWFGSSCLTFSLGGAFVVADPTSIPPTYPGEGGIVLFTHDHDDHYTAQVARDFISRGATVFAPFAFPGGKLLRPGQTAKIGNLTIEAVPAYNIKKAQFHPKPKNYAGFVLRGDGLSVYLAGDTERIPEMKKIRADVVFMPLGQTYTMGSVEEAAAAVTDIAGVTAAAAYHYGPGAAEGTAADAERFAALLDGKVEVWELPNMSGAPRD